MNDFTWLIKLVAELPKIKRQRKSIYEIAGFPYWENVNSNILAFYFDETEEHGFGRLFLQSFIKILIKKEAISEKDAELYETAYTVEREVMAAGKRIDIVIKSKEESTGNANWALIIENKMNAPLYNDLPTYYNETKAQNKKGIVLSPTSKNNSLQALSKSKGVAFFSVTHAELIDAVKSNLADFFTETDDRHLLLLKEYFLNFQNMTTNQNQPELEKQLLLLQQQAANIDVLNKAATSVTDYAVNTLIRVMDHFGYFPYTPNTNVQSKHFYSNAVEGGDINIAAIPYFRFYVWLPDFPLKRKMNVNFELFDQYSKYGDGLKNYLRSNYNPPAGSPLQQGTAGGQKDNFYHLFRVINYELPQDPTKSFELTLTDFFKATFFNDTENLVNISAAWMKENYIAEVKVATE